MNHSFHRSDRTSRVQSLLVTVVLVALFGGLAHGQKAPELDYLIRFTAQMSPAQEKHIHEALQSHEPGAGVWVDCVNSQVKVRTHVELDRPALESVWSPVGLTIAHVSRIHGQLPMERSMAAGANTFPVFVNTGNPEQDTADYEAAKAAWISAHPEVDHHSIPPSER